MTKKLWIAVVASSALMLTACSGISSPVVGEDGRMMGPDGQLIGENNGESEQPLVCKTGSGSKYTGFAGTELVDDRLPAQENADRARVKPFSSLAAEYTRVLGTVTPAFTTAIGALGPTFGEPVARWSAEPQASAVSLYAAYKVAFQGCLTYTGTAPAYAAAPTDASAATECGNFATKFWSRSADSAEVAACVKATVADTTTETDPRRRWAYGCASAMTAAGFLSY